MARYVGPVCRLCRRHGEKLYLKGDRCFTPKCAFERRPNPPGPRPARRRKVSDRGLQLREKQRARVTYGVLERQFVRYYKEAIRRPGVSGENLVRLLETRLDNMVYRAGFRNRVQAMITGKGKQGPAATSSSPLASQPVPQSPSPPASPSNTTSYPPIVAAFTAPAKP